MRNLGPQSSQQALSIRASNASHPERGLQIIWERLEERYASPHSIEASIKEKLSQDFKK